MKRAITIFLLFVGAASAAEKAPTPAPQVPQARVLELATVEGVRDNPLIGYGIVVGLNGTGDRRQTVFTTQTLANILQRMGVQIPASAVRVNNAAAVFVTANLPPFAGPGTRIDVTISSVGDAKSLEGGLLLLTGLMGADGQVYASAQGPLTVGGYSAGVAGNSRQVNHPTVARIPLGAQVEKVLNMDLRRVPKVALLLREADFVQAREVVTAVNKEFGKPVAAAVDSRRIEIDPTQTGVAGVPELLARVEDLRVPVHPRSRVVVNERTGTIVMGRQVRLSAVSILHGNLAIEIATQVQVSQPQPLTNGQTTVVQQPTVRAVEAPARRIELAEGATVDELVNGLQAIGATARDVVAILQAIKAANALQGELEVI